MGIEQEGGKAGRVLGLGSATRGVMSKATRATAHSQKNSGFPLSRLPVQSPKALMLEP
jgi:hypothetical protein